MAATPEGIASVSLPALRASLERVRSRIAQVHADDSSPDTRLADNALEFNPASVVSLVQLTQGGLQIARPAWSPTSPFQGGGYGEHALTSISDGKPTFPLRATSFEVRLAPGCGIRLEIAVRRYATPPTLKLPWTA